jgi:hypothetical protein
LLKQKWKRISKQTALEPGAVFGRLTVIKSERQWVTCVCACDNGNRPVVWKYDLVAGRTTSCGCFMRETSAENMRRTSTVHGGWGSKEWNSWDSMIDRCVNPKAMGYENYGGRGIYVCRRWQGRHGFRRFLNDMGKAPSAAHTIDRKNNDRHYTPGNTQWATKKEQARNRRSNRMITAFGKRQCLAAWAEETGLSPTTIRLRLLKGWSSRKALGPRPGEHQRHV